MDGAKHTWNLIALVDRDENCKVLVGKNKSEVFWASASHYYLFLAHL